MLIRYMIRKLFTHPQEIVVDFEVKQSKAHLQAWVPMSSAQGVYARVDLSDRPIGQTTSSGCATWEVEHFIGTPSNESSNAESSFSEVSTVHGDGIDAFAGVPVGEDSFDKAS